VGTSHAVCQDGCGLHRRVVPAGIEFGPQFVQLVAKESTRVEGRGGGVVEEVPDLVAPPDLVIGPQVITEDRPCERGVQQPVHHDEGLLGAVVGFHQEELRLAARHAAQEVRDLGALHGPGPLQQGGPGGRKVRRKGARCSTVGDRLVVQRTKQPDRDFPSARPGRAFGGDCRDRARDGFRWIEFLDSLPLRVLPDCEKRRAKAVPPMVRDFLHRKIPGRLDEVEVTGEVTTFAIVGEADPETVVPVDDLPCRSSVAFLEPFRHEMGQRVVRLLLPDLVEGLLQELAKRLVAPRTVLRLRLETGGKHGTRTEQQATASHRSQPDNDLCVLGHRGPEPSVQCRLLPNFGRKPPRTCPKAEAAVAPVPAVVPVRGPLRRLD